MQAALPLLKNTTDPKTLVTNHFTPFWTALSNAFLEPDTLCTTFYTSFYNASDFWGQIDIDAKKAWDKVHAHAPELGDVAPLSSMKWGAFTPMEGSPVAIAAAEAKKADAKAAVKTEKAEAKKKK